jgi:hypothetical protein
MSNVNVFLGWAGLLVIGLFMAGLFYVDVSARRLLRRITQEGTSDNDLRSTAALALTKGFRARVEWLKSKQEHLRGDTLPSAQLTLRVYSWCWISLVVLFGLWAAAMLMPGQ